jgi:hypothetical protein
MIKPVRLQLSRKKGFKLVSPNGLLVVKVDRTTRHGNPFSLELVAQEMLGPSEVWSSVAAARRSPAVRRRAVEKFQENLETLPEYRKMIRRELHGKNLACWCPLPKAGEPDLCHARILLELANRSRT